MLKLCAVLVVILCIKRSSSQNFFGCVAVDNVCPNKYVSFYHYTRETQDNPTKIDLNNRESALSVNYVKNKPLIVIIHGYTCHKDETPNTHLRPAFFKRDNFNIISVDYKEIAKYPCYYSAAYSIATVANCTAQMIDFMVDENIFSMSDIHVIGFSLGAQTAGMVANYIKDGRKLKRITGRCCCLKNNN
jgi:pimeloyl-ACP methyl ester carboxylesterase